MTAGQRTAAPPRRPRARCGMCGGRVRIRPGVWNPWVECTSCKGWAGSEPAGGGWIHRAWVALAVPSWAWWTIHNEPTARVWSRCWRAWYRVVCRVGFHPGYDRGLPARIRRCSQCGWVGTP